MQRERFAVLAPSKIDAPDVQMSLVHARLLRREVHWPFAYQEIPAATTISQRRFENKKLPSSSSKDCSCSRVPNLEVRAPFLRTLPSTAPVVVNPSISVGGSVPLGGQIGALPFSECKDCNCLTWDRVCAVSCAQSPNDTTPQFDEPGLQQVAGNGCGYSSNCASGTNGTCKGSCTCCGTTSATFTWPCPE